ncbi:DNA-directed RNA polymerase I subunit RPA49 [Wickerhamiella sorbophila]|uniref:DNA-directed RNA polymerase I subunit RPA49 n=1 Tax=Wickerhamiella sorbophila TaxID=45607 RepID=A0A2T0FFX8_9ASCO|nr:DNA-directed RNA polymerase I subunit RPA49 [Wickerhamiella sorbophila]PRT53903.1 DNA-directed RNA polymerase I subunit RPA49 [Wickerhamiella sorbophila]
MPDAVVVRLPGINVPEDAKFEVFSKNQKSKSQDQLIEGEHGSIAYEGTQDDHKYCLAIKDAKTGKIRLVEAPVHSVSSHVKDRRELEDKTVIRQASVLRWEQRTALGEAFGTKKAKAAITDAARNRLDADMLEGFEGAIVDSVKDATSSLPSKEQRQQAMTADRPIPQHNSETSNVDEIYPIDGIVSQNELHAIDIEAIEKASNAEERAQALPFKVGDYVDNRIASVIADGSDVRRRLRILAYIGFLMAVYGARRATSKPKLVEKLGAEVPDDLVDGALRRFAVSKAGMFGTTKERNFTFDPSHCDKLLCYMLALTLHIDNFQVNVTPLAHELALKPSKLIDLFRNLGCTIKNPSATQAKELGLSSTQASTYRIAVLKAPLVLPDVVRRKRR